MATSSSCNSIGAAIDKLGRRIMVHQEASPCADSSLLHVGLPIKATDDHLHISICNSTLQASRFATIAVAATAWAGLSMCPVEALAMAYENEYPHSAGESAFAASTSMLQLSGYVKLPGDGIGIDIGIGIDAMHEIQQEDGMHIFNAGMEATIIRNVPSIKPPNQGSNSPWVPKINGLKKKDDSKTASMRCPKWTQSELEMVLPDFQGWPKPVPRMQGHPYPFWAATASTNVGVDGNESLFVIESTPSTVPNDGAQDTQEQGSNTLPPSPPPPSKQFHKPIKKASCFTM